MTRLISCCTVVGALLLIAGCVIARDVQLYPDNAAAHALGPLHARIVGHGNLNGTATMGLRGFAFDGRSVFTEYSDTLHTAPQVLEPLTSRPLQALVSRHVRDLCVTNRTNNRVHKAASGKPIAMPPTK